MYTDQINIYYHYCTNNRVCFVSQQPYVGFEPEQHSLLLRYLLLYSSWPSGTFVESRGMYSMIKRGRFCSVRTKLGRVRWDRRNRVMR